MKLKLSATSPEPAIQRASSFALICLGLFLLVAVVSVVCLMLFPGTSGATQQHVAHFEGKDSGTTGTFTVGDAWEFRWTHNGHFERIIWRQPDGEEDFLMEMPGKPIRYQGGVNIPRGGEFSFEVMGQGDWTIDVYQF